MEAIEEVIEGLKRDGGEGGEGGGGRVRSPTLMK